MPKKQPKNEAKTSFSHTVMALIRFKPFSAFFSFSHTVWALFALFGAIFETKSLNLRQNTHFTRFQALWL
ncbi:MAG: hypothetical protein IJY43_06395 [Clostridia bacterium]|nr:hypothetical protein [Clostridia bacterium]